MTNAEIDGLGEIDTSEEVFTFGEKSFTIDFSTSRISTNIEDLAPDDGEFHNVFIGRQSMTTTTHCDEYINGVLFVVTKQVDGEGKLLEAHYVRADLVRG